MLLVNCQFTVGVLSACYQCTGSALSLHCQCAVSALTVHWQCAVSALWACWKCTVIVLSVHCQCAVSALAALTARSQHWQRAISMLSALSACCQCDVSTKICTGLVKSLRIWCLRFEISDYRSEIEKTPKFHSQSALGAVQVQSQHSQCCIVCRKCCQHAACAEQRTRVGLPNHCSSAQQSMPISY